jgi:hypothetical protein
MNVTINILELASELASIELEENWGDTLQIFVDDEDNECIKYTPQAQDIFNDLYDKYYDIIEKSIV